MKKKEYGITLVALVVTIVVLLILAGITITYVMGDNSILKKASDARMQTEIVDYKERLEEKGLICSGTSPNGNLVEIIENINHPFFVAGQFHPEFKSRPDRPAPLFKAFIKAAKEL